MMKFEEPKLNVEELEVEDVITASTGDSDCDYQTECLTD
jgi:hypothetical protein